MLVRTLPRGFIAPCLPTQAETLPSGGAWLHEIKHDGLRIIARKNGERVRLYSRPGNDLTGRFPLIVETLARLRARSCIIDGEAVVCDDNGVASFDLVRHQRANGSVFLYAFDLIELNGDDLRRDPLEVRKATLRSALAKAGLGLRFNEHNQIRHLRLRRRAYGRVMFHKKISRKMMQQRHSGKIIDAMERKRTRLTVASGQSISKHRSVHAWGIVAKGAARCAHIYWRRLELRRCSQQCRLTRKR